MSTWPTSPEWTDVAQINGGNLYNDNDGVTASDFNAIVENLLYLEQQGVGKPKLQEKEFIADVNNVGTIIQADEGYDGLSAVLLTIQVPDSPLPIEISTEAEMTALLKTAEVGSVYKYTGTTGTYENGALYVVEESE